MSASAFPGGTSVSRLSVYSGQCADGLAGGTPHLHTASTEAYVVIGGTGTLQTLDMSGFRETPLETGSTVWFTPGVIHRAVNRGDLRVVVVMSNAGLPEAGDAVMTFPPDIVSDPDRYRDTATLPDAATLPDVSALRDAVTLPDAAALPDAATLLDEAVRRRRDLAVAGFQQLVAGGEAALLEFYGHATALVRPNVTAWRELWNANVAAETRRTARVLDALADGDGSHLREAGLWESPQSEQARWGMCGRLHTHDLRGRA